MSPISNHTMEVLINNLIPPISFRRQKMFIYTGNLSHAEELTNKNEVALFDLIKRNEYEYKKLIFNDTIPNSKKGFSLLLKSYFNNGRIYQFVVMDKNKKVIGTFFFYGYNKSPCSVFISCFFTPQVRGKLIIREALAAASLFAIDIINIEELHFSIYNYNNYMLNLSKKIQATECVSKNSNTKEFLLKKEQIYKLIFKK